MGPEQSRHRRRRHHPAGLPEDHFRASLVADALDQALKSRRPAAGLIFHSDRGSHEWRALLSSHGLYQSMSVRANPYHNAWTESFMGTLKAEMLRDGRFICERDARLKLFDYIKTCYTPPRRHSSLGYLSPADFEAKHCFLN